MTGSSISVVIKNRLCFLIFILLVFYQSKIFALDWRFTPSLTINETWSDNINLAPSGSERSAFVTAISPGISLQKGGARTQFDLNYRMQNLFNAGGEGTYNLNHQLQFNLNSELVKRSVFLDANASYSQQNIFNIRQADDNLSGSDNRTNVASFGISPYWRPRFNGYATGELRFRYNRVIADNELTSNTNTFEESIRLVSGWRFSRFNWALNFVNRDQIRDDESNDNVNTLNADALLRFNFNRYFSVFSRVGYVNNQFQSTTGENQNGIFYTFGASYRPSNRFGIEAGYGNNIFVTVDIRPTRHSHWVTTYRNNDVGDITGSTWETRFDLRTKRSVWSASYDEQTTTSQTLLAQLQTFTLQDAFGEPILDPVTNQPVQFDLSLPSLVNEVFISRRGEISVTYNTGKSNLSGRIFNIRRTFQVSQNNDDVLGVSGTWDWNPGLLATPGLQLFLRPFWQQTKRDESTDERFDVSIGVRKSIPFRFGSNSQMNATLEYRYTNQTSDLEFNEFEENRVTAGLQVSF